VPIANSLKNAIEAIVRLLHQKILVFGKNMWYNKLYCHICGILGGKTMKCVTIHTLELDDFDLVMEELNEQLSKIVLGANTVGIINCHPEFIYSGMVAHLANNLPFGIVGMTAAVSTVNDNLSPMMLSIFVMTADDVEFEIGMTGDATENVQNAVKTKIEEMGYKTGEHNDIKMVLGFAPSTLQHPGDSYVEAWTDVLPGVPLFGALACDDTLTWNEARNICGDDFQKDAMAFVLVKGNYSPRFAIATLPDDAVLPYRGKITKASGNNVYEVNGMPMIKYMDSIGFLEDEGGLGMHQHAPWDISQQERADYDGVPVLRSVALVEAEAGGVFRGKVDEGSMFVMRDVSRSAILSATSSTLEEIANMDNVQGILSFGCLLRFLMLAEGNNVEELTKIKDSAGDVPVLASYVGGEICPTSSKDGVYINRFHNCTAVFLVV